MGRLQIGFNLVLVAGDDVDGVNDLGTDNAGQDGRWTGGRCRGDWAVVDEVTAKAFQVKLETNFGWGVGQ